MSEIGRMLVALGIVAVVIGLLFILAPSLPWLGRLPGDLLVRRGRYTVYFPIVTCLVVSLVLTVLLNLFFRR